ncbi:MAG: hypothetical protein DMG59_10495, partial [Acidobacteria bacterium]
MPRRLRCPRESAEQERRLQITMVTSSGSDAKGLFMRKILWFASALLVAAPGMDAQAVQLEKLDGKTILLFTPH